MQSEKSAKLMELSWAMCVCVCVCVYDWKWNNKMSSEKDASDWALKLKAELKVMFFFW